ncbi:hypothetical protein DR864_29375 (plasmid) [Runella rosea]|uniref:Polymorphic outer membrane protein repeat-containing protein n=1 Tax=Runella rosea TaxID=2259595 RepID=A0A344TTK7_9BACT|nr:hypothetical protein [Runella rosea]AXE21978.1 hypothetical protein DR864_29375 [Runella rosea]
MKYLFLTATFLLTTFSCFAEIYYVKTTGNDTSNDGRSWAAAFSTLQKSLEVCQYGDQIWVAEGTYKPTAYPAGAIPYTPPLTNRDKSFHLVNGVKIYGGFIGIEGAVSERTAGHETILSGDIGTENNDTDNCYHVVISVKDDSTTVLDGFTITKGKADGGSLSLPGTAITLEGKPIGNAYGGGMFNVNTLLKINNCKFILNSSNVFGGGVMNTDQSFTTLTNLTFTSNSSTDGGGMHNVDSSPILMNIIFSNNTAKFFGGGLTNRGNSFTNLANVIFSNNKAEAGGGMINQGASPVLTYCTFLGNTAGFQGGGMANWGNSTPKLTNVTFSGNSTIGDGGGMQNSSSSPILINIIFVSNSAPSGRGGGYLITIIPRQH